MALILWANLLRLTAEEESSWFLPLFSQHYTRPPGEEKEGCFICSSVKYCRAVQKARACEMKEEGLSDLCLAPPNPKQSVLV